MFPLYRGLTWLALTLVPFYVAATLLRGRGRWDEVTERLARLPEPLVRAARGGIWIQAASVGELRVARLLTQALSQRRPDLPVVLSVTTPAARRMVTESIPGTVGSFTFPVDLPPLVRRAVSLLQPCLFVAVETEIWPNLFDTLKRHGTPVVVVNGRISDGGFSRYRRIRQFLARPLSAVQAVCARSSEDADRFRSLGMPAARVHCVGDLKFDIPRPVAGDIAPEVRRYLEGKLVLVAGSTHPGEEEPVLEAAQAAVASTNAVLAVVLAPRHHQRLKEVEATLRRSGLPWVRRSALAGAAAAPTSASPLCILLLDTHGELASIYATADAALLGGTLAPVGGHNPLEAAAAGIPAVAGPHLGNVRETAALLEEAGALVVADDRGGVVSGLSALLVDAEDRRRRGEAAHRVLAAHGGAVERTLQALLRFLPAPASTSVGH